MMFAIAIAAGLLSHWLYFIRGEHHMKAPLYFRLFWGTFCTICLFQLRFVSCNIHRALSHSLAIALSYLIGLYSSITVYRLFFHRARHFPGPRILAVTKLWHSWQGLNAQNHLYLEKLHKGYGDFVRTGEWPLSQL